MSPRAQENAAVAVLGAIFIGYIGITLGFGPNARLVPLPIALVGLVCLAAQAVRQNLRRAPEPDRYAPLSALVRRRQAAPRAEPEPVPEPEPKPEPTKSGEGRRELTALAIVALLVALIVALGPVAAVFTFSAGYFALSRQYAVVTSIAAATVFALAVYLLFGVGLDLELYHGLLEPLVSRFP